MKLDLSRSFIKENVFSSRDYKKKIKVIYNKLHSADQSAGLAWVDWPEKYDKKEFNKILKLAKQIQSDSDALLVVGIGGSYLGAKSGIDMLGENSNVQVLFTGTSFDYSDLASKLEYLKDKNITVNVVSKSGTTVEILTTLHVIERFMKNKYKADYKKRMIFTTDKHKGYLRSRADAEGIETLSVPDNMGGRYSVLSAVGLLPFAVAGINIKKIMEGALQAYNDLKAEEIENNIAFQYAIYRHIVYTKLNKKLELFTSFSTKFERYEKWLQQLFCESEGKSRIGLFVSTLIFSKDLHSVGQFIQQGSPIIAETFLNVENPAKDFTFSNIPLGTPIKFIEGKTFNDISRASYEGTLKSHSNAGVPIAVISIPEINEYHFGYLVYFFEMSCAVSGYLLEINPFDQPGVEQYKNYMRFLLKN